MENDSPHHTSPMVPSSIPFPLAFSFPSPSFLTLFSWVSFPSFIPSNFLIFPSFLFLHRSFWDEMAPNLHGSYLIRSKGQIFETNNWLEPHPNFFYPIFSQMIPRNKSNSLRISPVQIHILSSFDEYWSFPLTIVLKTWEWGKGVYPQYEI